MTAATKNRNTPHRLGLSRGLLVAAAAECFAGTIAVINATGFTEPGKTATGLVAAGVFEHYQDNTDGADGDEVVEVKRGNFHLANSAGADEITAADIGKVCYIVDDQTVAKTSDTDTRSPAGIVDDVDDAGVWVNIDPTNGVAASV
ncbi:MULTISPECIES: hypothetical protein [Vreelandella]|uniref:Uncharacterized protein n=2 Tax=Vreelandella TaxID=3137766 RepID=A0A7Y6VAY5_9GAMM|nr:hypothetical protein [Halomonas subterranea]NVF15991.1 hypothetical protein [Halomonas maris]SER78659.1 hypothetical protein SAMN04487958_1032 [Halomonas subterranea]